MKATEWTPRTIICLGVAIMVGNVGGAEVVNPTSYSMPNGFGQASSGVFNYWDLDYSGTGETMTDGAPLFGGRGDLTDGIVASGNWFNVENVAGSGPYVGWIGIDPKITFHFPGAFDLSTVRVHFDDSNGSGGVMPPRTVTIAAGGFTDTLPVPDPIDGMPFWAEFDISHLNIRERSISLTFAGQDEWIFASEVQFLSIPEPCRGWAFLAWLIFIASRRSASF